MVFKKRKKQALLTVSGVILVTIFGIKWYLNPDQIEQYGSYVVYPVLLFRQRVIEPINQALQRKKQMHELEMRIALLQREKETLLAENIELNSMLDHLHDIKELTDFKDRYLGAQQLLTQVLSKQFNVKEHYFWIDAGANKGVAPEMIAVYKDCLVGRVTDVFPWYSKVELITDKTCKIAAHCAQSKASGIFQGTNQEAHAQLNHVSHLAQVQFDDLVISSGEGLVFPRGFGIGRIKQAKIDGLFYMIDIQPLLDLRTLSYCYVLKRDKDTSFELTATPASHTASLK